VQHNTCPPSAALRHCSMADMTFKLIQAQVAMLALAPGRPVGAEDIRDLQQWAWHDCTLPGRQHFQRTDHLAQQVGGDLDGSAQVVSSFR